MDYERRGSSQTINPLRRLSLIPFIAMARIDRISAKSFASLSVTGELGGTLEKILRRPRNLPILANSSTSTLWFAAAPFAAWRK
jgi:hypothetical protein